MTETTLPLHITQELSSVLRQVTDLVAGLAEEKNITELEAITL